MKLFLFAISSTYAGKLSEPAPAAELECTWDCFTTMFKETLKCRADEEATEEEILECDNQALSDFWYSCLGERCGANLPDGTCGDKCTPILIEEVTKCDG